MKIIQYIFLIITFCLFVGCGDHSKLKNGYLSYSLNTQEQMNKLEIALKKKNISFYKYAEDHKEYIAYPVKYQSEVKNIVYEIMGIYKPYTRTKTLCSTSEKQKKEEADILVKNKITHTTKESVIDGETIYCLYWPVEEDDKVLSVLPVYKAIQEACNNDPDCPK